MVAVTWASIGTLAIWTVLCGATAALQHGGSDVGANSKELHKFAKRASLAPARGAALVSTTSTVPLASGRGRKTSTSASTISKTTSTKAVSTTSKPSTTKTTSTSTKTIATTTKSTSSTRTTSKTTTASTKASTTTSKMTSTTSKTSSTAAPAASTSAKPVYSKKKGISYNEAAYTALLDSSISWAYNWYSAPQSRVLPSSVEFAPMLWSNATDLTSVWATNVNAAKARGGTHLLAFNEPDLNEQSNMTIAQSVGAYKQYMQPYGKNFKLVSPAVTNGGPPMGVAYLQQFLANCTGCQVDAVALHWYDAAWNTGYFINYMSDAIKAFAPRPIWLTEFRGSGTAAEQIKFINTVVPWMEKQAGIERYAIFGLFEGAAADGNMITNGKLNEVGLAYAQAG